jgi:hypothetical protein
MTDEPVDITALSGARTLTTGASAEKADVTEATCHQMVTKTESFPVEPRERLEMTHVSEIHVTSEVAVEPWVTTRLFMFE